MDKLSDMFERQLILQDHLDVDIYNIEYQKDMVLASIDELMEALREIPWKPWKKQQKFNKEAFQEEIIDLWHFIINLTLSAEMDANKVYSMFKDKNHINHMRIEEGY